MQASIQLVCALRCNFFFWNISNLKILLKKMIILKKKIIPKLTLLVCYNLSLSSNLNNIVSLHLSVCNKIFVVLFLYRSCYKSWIKYAILWIFAKRIIHNNPIRHKTEKLKISICTDQKVFVGVKTKYTNCLLTFIDIQSFF